MRERYGEDVVDTYRYKIQYFLGKENLFATVLHTIYEVNCCIHKVCFYVHEMLCWWDNRMRV